MPRIVISYRRSDSDAFAGRIRDHVVNRFGAASVFMDIENIPVGEDFRRHIEQVLRGSDVVLAVVGQNWLSGGNARDRILKKDDPIRVEIETALVNKVPIIPVLQGSASMPEARQLPASIRAFAYINAEKVDPGRDFQTHIERLLADIERIIGAFHSPDSGRQISIERPAAKSIERSEARLLAKIWSSLPISRTAAIVGIAAVSIVAAFIVGRQGLDGNQAALEFKMANAEQKDVSPRFRSTIDTGPTSGPTAPTPSAVSDTRYAAIPPCEINPALDRAACDVLAPIGELLNELYSFRRAQATSERKVQLANDHRNWRLMTNQCQGPDMGKCLVRMYDARIEELKMGPSYRCEQALTVVEKRICSNMLLATKDQMLHEQYYAILGRLPASEKGRVRESQKRWLESRNRCSGSSLETCVSKAYDGRLAELGLER